ncbi:MAG: DUF4932 domain-containing protein [Sphingobacteriaceae bacterium]|nr:MAG: DUF4932 domain-containing protein [Sphingobacteriaceae bacterium]
MITKFVFIVFVIFSFATTSLAQSRSKKLEVAYSKNVETYFLAELLAVDHRIKNKNWEEFKRKECSSYQPIVKAAIDELNHLKGDDIAFKTAALNDTLMSYGFGNDVMMDPLLYHKEFPNKDYLPGYQFKSTHLDKKRQKEVEKIIRNYIEQLNSFYQAKNINSFFKKHQIFYKGAINEVSKYVKEDITTKMENFYGQKKQKYFVLVSPMMMWPIEDNEGRGIGANVKLSEGEIVYEIMSPYVRVNTAGIREQYEHFGFDYKPRAQSLTVHEFGHSFVNYEVEKYNFRINKSDSLFTDKLKKAMSSKGVGSWQVYIIESLVRLGEIRVAELQNDKYRAEALRKYHVSQEHFIFLPSLENKIKEYEKNRKHYPTFNRFMPKLLEVFESSNMKFVNESLQKQ